MLKKFFILCLAMLTGVSVMAADFTLTSSDLKAGGDLDHKFVLNGFGCKGGNISPALEWSNAPKGTKSFAVTVYDPDAPTGSGWWHWTVFNIPAGTDKLATGAGSGKAALPKGSIQGRTDFGASGYGGACPPEGSRHRYIFTVYALKDVLPLDADKPAAMVGFYIHNMKLGEASLTAYYGR